jgi:hypothetical protein
MTYVIRARKPGQRASLLGYDKLMKLAEKIPATEDERAMLVLLGLKEHVPRELRSYYDHLERDNRTMRRKLGRPELRPRLSVKGPTEE